MSVESLPSRSSNGHLSRRGHWAGGEPPVSALMARALAQPSLVSLAAGFVDRQTLPVEPTRRALEALWANPEKARAALQYGTTIGYPPLRSLLAERIRHEDATTSAPDFSLDQVVITAGSNQLLYLLSDVLLDPGDIVLCAAPSYFVYLGALESLGAVGVGVACDEYGVIPEALDEQLRAFEAAGELDRVKAIYAVSYFDNPGGLTIPSQRRARIVELAKRWSRRRKIYVIEDAAYRELRYRTDDVPSMRSFDEAGDTVIYTGTFSKSFSPGVRVGFGILPRQLVEPMLALKGHVDFGSPNFNQVLMATILEEGLYEPHIALLRSGYGEKIDAILAAADRHLRPIEGVGYVRPAGGLYVWLRLPEHLDASSGSRLFDLAIEEGVLYVPGEHCYPSRGEPLRRNRLRLSFGVQSCDAIARGVESLARAVRSAAG